MNLTQLQGEARDWQRKNFGKIPAWQPLLIIVEELGELAHSYIKREQGIRLQESHEANMRDAVADVVIGVASFCAAEGIDLDAEVEKTWALVKQRDWKKNPNDAHKGLGDTQ